MSSQDSPMFAAVQGGYRLGRVRVDFFCNVNEGPHVDMLRRKSIGLLVLFLVGAGLAPLGAKADDGTSPGSPPPYHEYPSIWQGMYAGAHLGWSSSGDLDGIIGGGQVGYNWQVNQIVYGLEADAAFADISGSSSIFGITVSESASMW